LRQSSTETTENSCLEAPSVDISLSQVLFGKKEIWHENLRI